MLDRLLGEGHGYGWERVRANDVAGTILAADESRVMFEVAWDERTRAALGKGDRVAAAICYRSFLDECWVSGADLRHARVDRCPSP